MSINHRLFLDTAASRHEIRDALALAGIGLEANPDRKNTSGVSSAATSVTIVDDLSRRLGRPDNGVMATRYVSFHDRRLYLDEPDNPVQFTPQTIQGAMALLKAFAQADAYMVGWDANAPLLLRRNRRLVLAQARTEPDGFWGADGSPRRALVDLPYTVEPLGPWDYIEFGVPEWELGEQPAAS